MPAETVELIHRLLEGEIQQAGGRLDSIALCPHRPDAGCSCRKPAPGLLDTLIARHGYQRSQTVFIGDSLKDLLAAERADLASILVLTGKGRATADQLDQLARPPLHITADLAAAIALLTAPPA